MTSYEMVPQPHGRQQNIASARNYFADINPQLKECDVEAVARGIIWLAQIAAEEDDKVLFEEWRQQSESFAVHAQGLPPAQQLEINACLTEVYFHGLRLGDTLSQQKLYALLEKSERESLCTIVAACQKWDISPTVWIETFAEESLDKIYAWDYYYHLYEQSSAPYDQSEAVQHFNALAVSLMESDAEPKDLIDAATVVLSYITDQELRHELVDDCRELVSDINLCVESYDALVELAAVVFKDRDLGSLHEEWLCREEEMLREDLQSREGIEAPLMVRAQFAIAHRQCNGADAEVVAESINELSLIEKKDQDALFLRDSLLAIAALQFQRYRAADDAARLVAMINNDRCWHYALKQLAEAKCDISAALPDVLDPMRGELFDVFLSIANENVERLSQQLFTLIGRALIDKVAFDTFMYGADRLQRIDQNEAVALTQELCNAAKCLGKSEMEERLYMLLNKWRADGTAEGYRQFIEEYAETIAPPLTFERYALLALMAR